MAGLPLVVLDLGNGQVKCLCQGQVEVVGRGHQTPVRGFGGQKVDAEVVEGRWDGQEAHQEEHDPLVGPELPQGPQQVVVVHG